jgi:hypothetical protein
MKPSSQDIEDAPAACVAVDAEMAVAAMFVAPAKVTAIVRVFRFAACALAPVVTPVAIVTLHVTPEDSVAVAADNVTAAPAVPELAVAAVNVVEPQPFVVGVDKDPRVNVGSTTLMVSAAASGALSEKCKEIEDAPEVTEFAITNPLNVTADASIAVDFAIDAAAMFVDEARVIAAVRVFRFCA